MAKNKTISALKTSELPGMPKKMGRPVTGNAKSAAERMRAYRARQSEARGQLKATAEGFFEGWTLEQLQAALVADGQVFQGVWVEIGRRMGWLK